jgi:GlpG protein
MRQIGRLEDEMQARRFGDFLYSRKIENQVEPTAAGGWVIWVVDESHLEEAVDLFERFAARPDDPMFVQGAGHGARQRHRQEQAHTPKRARIVDARTAFYRPPVGYGTLTITLIVISVVVTLVVLLGGNDRLRSLLSISEHSPMNRFAEHLPEIRHGQIWRLFTPMFLHFGPLHIIFNMLWLRDLGSMIETRKGTWTLLALVLVISAISNLGQYFVSGPSFGGMSGVVFGLLGYIWMQGKFDPASGLELHPQTVMLMIGWFFLGLTGMIGNIANTAHGVGAVVGITWGFLAAHWSIWRRHHR